MSDIMTVWDSRMEAICAGYRVAPYLVSAQHLWKENPELHGCFIESAYEWGVLKFDHEYAPFEPATKTYPGCNAQITVIDVTLLGMEIDEGDIPPKVLERMEQDAWTKVEEARELAEGMIEDAADSRMRIAKEMQQEALEERKGV